MTPIANNLVTKDKSRMTSYLTIEKVLENLDFTNSKYKSCEINDICEIMQNKNIVLYDYYLTHDGYDEYGPKSDLYDIFIVTYEDNQYIFYEFHFENWYDSLKEEIELVKSFILNNESLDEIKNYYSIQHSDSGKEFIQNIEKLIDNNST
jgi:hypothetical protein